MTTAIILTLATLLTPTQHHQWQTAHDQWPRWIPPPPATTVDPIHRWEPLVAEHFHPDHVDDALAVIACESTGDPNADNRKLRASTPRVT